MTIQTTVDNAEKFWNWIKTRGGVAHWPSVNLSNPSASWSTPALTEEGLPYPKPTWQADSKPSHIETDPSKIEIITDKEVKRFRVALRRSGNGLSLKLTDGSQRKLDKALLQAGDESFYRFDYDTQEAVILTPASKQSLLDWARMSGKE